MKKIKKNDFVKFTQNVFLSNKGGDLLTKTNFKRKYETNSETKKPQNKRLKYGGCFSDKNTMIYIQNTVDVFKLFQSLKLVISPVIEILINLLNHPLSTNFNNTNNISSQVKDFLKTSKIDGVINLRKS